MTTPKSIDHVCLLVTDLEKTKSYLESIFDFQFAPHPNAENTLMVESKHVHFFIKEHPSPTEQHLSFEVDDLTPIKEKLDSFNIKYEEGTFTGFKHRNYNWLEWHDPDRIRLECITPLQ